MNSVRIAAFRCGSAAMKRTACAAPITAGNTTTPASASRCRQSGGNLWAYMGPPELKPPLPAFEWTELPPTHRYVSKRWQECNYLQAMEGGIESSHVSFLHSGELGTDPLHRETKGAQYQ